MAHVDPNLKYPNLSPRQAPPGSCLLTLVYWDLLFLEQQSALFLPYSLEINHTAHLPKHEGMHTDNRCTHPTSSAKSGDFWKFGVESSWLIASLQITKRTIEDCTEVDWIWGAFPNFLLGTFSVLRIFLSGKQAKSEALQNAALHHSPIFFVRYFPV